MHLWLNLIAEYSAQIVLVLVIVNILFVVINCMLIHQANRRIMLVEVKFNRLRDDITDTKGKVTQVTGELRRVTGEFDAIVDEELASAATKIRNRIKPEVDKEDILEESEE